MESRRVVFLTSVAILCFRFALDHHSECHPRASDQSELGRVRPTAISNLRSPSTTTNSTTMPEGKRGFVDAATSPLNLQCLPVSWSDIF